MGLCRTRLNRRGRYGLWRIGAGLRDRLNTFIVAQQGREFLRQGGHEFGDLDVLLCQKDPTAIYQSQSHDSDQDYGPARHLDFRQRQRKDHAETERDLRAEMEETRRQEKETRRQEKEAADRRYEADKLKNASANMELSLIHI